MRETRVPLAVFVSLVAITAAIAAYSGRDDEPSRCHATKQVTGRLRCWSGGAVVFEADTYRSGGVLCTADGVELKTTGSTDLCVEESWQADAWDPPPER